MADGTGKYYPVKLVFLTVDELIQHIEHTALGNINLKTSYDFTVSCYRHGVALGDIGIVEDPYNKKAPLLSQALKALKVRVVSITEPEKVGPKMRLLYKAPKHGRPKYRLPYYDNGDWEKFNEYRDLPKGRGGFFQKIKEFFDG